SQVGQRYAGIRPSYGRDGADEAAGVLSRAAASASMPAEEDGHGEEDGGGRGTAAAAQAAPVRDDGGLPPPGRGRPGVSPATGGVRALPRGPARPRDDGRAGGSDRDPRRRARRLRERGGEPLRRAGREPDRGVEPRLRREERRQGERARGVARPRDRR